MDFESMEKAMYGDVENDDELMAELLALEAEERAAGRMPTPTTNATFTAKMQGTSSSTQRYDSGAQERAAQVSTGARRMSGAYGISSVSDASDEDVGSDGDIDDPELLAELSDLVEQEGGTTHKAESPAASSSKPPVPAKPPPTGGIVDMVMLRRLHELKDEYSLVLKTAKEGNNASRAKRYQRGLDKIEELIGKVQAGKAIDESDIPVTLKASRTTEPPSSETAPVVPKHHEVPPSAGAPPSQVMPIVSEGITKPPPANTTPDQTLAKGILRGEQLRTELSNRRESYIINAKAANAEGDKKTAYEYYTVAKQFDEAIKAVNDGQVTECEESELPPPAVPYKPAKHEVIPPPPKTLLEGLQQRMQKYKSLCEQSKAENNERKYRMNSRILKQYEDAIQACRLNKPFDVSELPCPPGYPPLPSSGSAVAAAAGTTLPRRALPEVGPLAAPEPSASGRQSRQKQQLDFLLKRQLQFKQAAVAARNKGDVAVAKKLLLAAKGFDKMIAASKAGLPVNIEKTPIPPQAHTSSKTLKPSLEHHTSFDAAIRGTPAEVYATMEMDLIHQVKLCEDSRLAFTRLGDVTRVKMFEGWSSDSKRDLILLRELAKRGAAVPRFRYESRNIPSVEVCLDVDEHHVELTIIRVTDARLPAGFRSSTMLCFAPYLNGSKRKHRRKDAQSWKPSDGYLFVKYNFAFPHDAHQIGKTKVVDATNSPEYKEKFLLTINRKMKQLQRVIKRNCLKFEVFQKGGFLRSDRLIGTADCKLSGLEEKAQIHECVDLMEGRKQAGGKLEYRVRVREPLGEKKLNVRQQKWLVLES